jgi:hypothetical protein
MTHADWTLLVAGLIIVAIVASLSAVSRLGDSPRSARISARMLFVRLSLGVIFTLLGIVGTFLPIMQGWIFFLLAVMVIFPESRFAESVLVKAEPKLPRLVRWLRRMGIGRKGPSPESVPE